MGDSFETMVRVYKDPNDYAKDVKKLSKQGWEVLNTVDHQPRAGIFRTMSGLGLLGSRPKAEMVVTFQRAKGGRKRDKAPVGPVANADGTCPRCGNPVPETAYFCPSCHAQVKR